MTITPDNPHPYGLEFSNLFLTPSLRLEPRARLMSKECSNMTAVVLTSFQIVEKWFILSWSHLIMNGHIYIFLQPETFQIVEKWFVLRWSHLIVKGHNHFSTFQIVEKWLILSWSHLKVNGHIHFSTIWNTSIFLQSEIWKYFITVLMLQKSVTYRVTKMGDY